MTLPYSTVELIVAFEAKATSQSLRSPDGMLPYMASLSSIPYFFLNTLTISSTSTPALLAITHAKAPLSVADPFMLECNVWNHSCGEKLQIFC